MSHWFSHKQFLPACFHIRVIPVPCSGVLYGRRTVLLALHISAGILGNSQVEFLENIVLRTGQVIRSEQGHVPTKNSSFEWEAETQNIIPNLFEYAIALLTSSG